MMIPMRRIGEETLRSVGAIVGTVALVAALVLASVGAYTSSTRQAPEYTGSYVPIPPVPPSPPARLSIPDDPNVLFIGDSFTEGYGAADKRTQGFVPRLAALRGWDDVRIDGIGLTGFLRPGYIEEAQNTYLQRLKRLHKSGDFAPNLIVFQGGLNDSRYGSLQLTVAVRDTLNTAKELWPGAQLLLIGPITFQTSLAPVNAAYKRGALIADVPFIDANTQPIIPQEENVRLTIEDRWHPNDAGHQLVANTLSDRINALLRETP